MEKQQILEFIESAEQGSYDIVLAEHINEVRKLKFKPFQLFLFDKYKFNEKEKDKIREKHWGFRNAFNNYKSKLISAPPSPPQLELLKQDAIIPEAERFREPLKKDNIIPKI